MRSVSKRYLRVVYSSGTEDDLPKVPSKTSAPTTKGSSSSQNEPLHLIEHRNITDFLLSY